MNTSSSQSLNVSSSNLLSFKISAFLPYVLVVALSFALCFGFCKFAINKEIEINENIAKNVTQNILNVEDQMAKRLISGLAILEFTHNSKKPITKQKMQELLDYAGVDSLLIYNAKGLPIYSSTGSLANPAHTKYWANFPLLWEREPYFKEMMSKDREIKMSPIKISQAQWNRPFKSATMWSKKQNEFWEVKIRNINLQQMLIEGIETNKSIVSIKLQSPSGYVLTEADNSLKVDDATVQSPKLAEACNYIVKPVVSNVNGLMSVMFSFGDNKINKQAQSHGLTCDDNHYFYTAIFEFDKIELNKQLGITIFGFSLFTLLACIAIYYINAYSAKSSELADLSERTADKITHLCNTRLGEVRRYVTKIVKDSMRVNNMNKELPEEMVQLLNRAFREVDEKGLPDSIDYNKDNR